MVDDSTRDNGAVCENGHRLLGERSSPIISVKTSVHGDGEASDDNQKSTRTAEQGKAMQSRRETSRDGHDTLPESYRMSKSNQRIAPTHSAEIAAECEKG